MEKIAPRLSLAAWSLWLMFNLFTIFTWKSLPTSAIGFAPFFGEVGIKGAGIALSAILCSRPNRALAFTLAVVCLFALWKFYIGDILFHMLPQMGGLTLPNAIKDWWHRISDQPLHLIRTLTFAVFVCVSLIYWPFFGIIYGDIQRKLKN